MPEGCRDAPSQSLKGEGNIGPEFSGPLGAISSRRWVSSDVYAGRSSVASSKNGTIFAQVVELENGRRMPGYVLAYRRPRVAYGEDEEVIYEARSLRREFIDDATAIRWARHTIPREYGQTLGGKFHRAAPITLWRIEPDGRSMIWETRPARLSRSR